MQQAVPPCTPARWRCRGTLPFRCPPLLLTLLVLSCVLWRVYRPLPFLLFSSMRVCLSSSLLLLWGAAMVSAGPYVHTPAPTHGVYNKPETPAPTHHHTPSPTPGVAPNDMPDETPAPTHHHVYGGDSPSPAPTPLDLDPVSHTHKQHTHSHPPTHSLTHSSHTRSLTLTHSLGLPI